MYRIEQFREINTPGTMLVTRHGRARLSERKIMINDIINAIASGKIIEDYPDDFPFPSCLILGQSGNRPLHVVASIHDGIMYLITAYEPNPIKWESNWTTRR